MNADETPVHELPSVSVLLPAWNESKMIGRCLDSLLAIDWPNLEVIVCAGGIDETLDVARRYESIRVVVLEQALGEGKQRALRKCFARSTGDIAYFTDADCIITNEAFRSVMLPIVKGVAQAATGLSLPFLRQRSNVLVRYQMGKDLAGTRRHSAYAHGIHGRNSAVRRSVIERLNALNDDVPSGTDFHLGQILLKAGVNIAWTYSFVLSDYPTSPLPYLRMWRRWIKNVLVQGIVMEAYSETRSTAVGIGSSGLILTLPVAGVLVSRKFLPPWALLFGYVVRKRYIQHMQEVEAAEFRTYPKPLMRFPFFVLLDSLGAIAGLIAAIVPSMRSHW